MQQKSSLHVYPVQSAMYLASSLHHTVVINKQPLLQSSIRGPIYAICGNIVLFLIWAQRCRLTDPGLVPDAAGPLQ